MTQTVVGIDAGGTQTTCRLADATGALLAESRGPGANLQSEGEQGIARVLEALVGQVIDGHQAPKAICVGMAGVDRPEDVAIAARVVDRLGRGATAVIVNDALIALEAGVPGGPGAVLIAGTGSFAYGRDDAGRAARAGGWGYVLGDEGSGYWLGRQALRVVVRASDGRGPQTDLTEAVLKHYGLANAQGLVRKMSGGGAKPSAIADLARLVSSAAASGDAVAKRLISGAAHELAGAADSVVRRLGLERAPLFLTGGILRNDEGLRHEVIAQLAVRLPDLDPELLAAPPAQGAVHLAIQALNGTLRLPEY